ncbi:CHASE domain-containing protein [Shewanella sedimentimangrovi]|uniref:histidine kinase n=1 Tax=Shewanella sedimentimangrovi TaxID=2814293 RepID=A0ABX7R1J3_9GAMM|nr:CHASE domain-containing protein [Shewanella sedimentimangrovi]QSX37679.1 PAS domain S-box protein [Shewanella sedimentimangrovi]
MKLELTSLLKDKWVLLTLVLGIGLSLLVTEHISRRNEDRIRDAVRESADQAIHSALTRIELYQYGLRGARGAVLTAGEDGISRELFRRYSYTRNVDTEFPGARGFGFIRRVPEAKEAEFIHQARADDWPDFNTRQLARHPDERYIIQYIEPVDRNIQAVGLDIASELNRRTAADDAIDSGEVRLTGPITLVQATGLPQQSFLILMPIYRGGKVPPTREQRREAAFGWSYAPLIMSEVLADQRLDPKRMRLQLFDVTAEQEEVFFDSGQTDTDDLYPYEEIHPVFGRTWKARYSVTPLFVSQLHLPTSSALAILGISASLLLSALVGVININHRNKARLQQEQAKLAAIVESSADGIIGKTLAGVITSWNGGARKIFGYHADEALGQTVEKLLLPDDLKHEEAQILARLAQGESIPHFESQRRRKDGSMVYVSVTASPIYDDHNKVIGASTTVRDITEQKRSELKIQQLNSNLERQVQERTSELAKVNVLLSNVLRAASEVAIIATDIHGQIRLFNHGAECLLGYKSNEVQGHCTPVRFHLESELDSRAQLLSREYGYQVTGFKTLTIRSELLGAETREWTYVRKDGNTLPVSLSVTPMRDADNKIIGYLQIATDISQQRNHQQELEAARDELISVRDQLLMAAKVAQLGIWSWNLSSNSLEWNDKMYELYEQPTELRQTGLKLSHWQERLHPQDKDRIQAQLQATVEGISRFDPIFRLQLPSGQVRYIQAGAYVEYDGQGNALKVMGINRDITSERELESWLRQAKEQSDAASAAKSIFLANMSHEIRTPMNAALGMLQLLHKTELSAKQQEYVSKAQIAATSLLNLLNDILDYSKIDAGKLELELHPFSLNELMQDLAVILLGNLKDKNLELMYDIDLALPDLVRGDRLRLQQVLINLASNAIKFTEHGEVVIGVHLLERDEDQTLIRISVKDTGIGINKDQQQKIFEGFTQAEASISRRFGGTGLGLGISRCLIDLMGSELHLDSEPGVGSHFWFDLRLPAEDSPIALPQQCRGRVLVVDDNALSLTVMCRTLAELGFEYQAASGGSEALSLLAQSDEFDTVLLDCYMPDMTGFEVAREIKGRQGKALCPTIVMVTAYSPIELDRALDSGSSLFEAYICKPFTPSQLLNTLESAKTGSVSLPPVRPEPSQRLEGLRILLVEDNEFNRLVALELLEGEGAEVQIAEDGEQGVKLATDPRNHFDLVLMDMQMPGIDGLEATRRIRSHGELKQLPIIAMTANVSAEDQRACLLAGMNAHLGKPLDFSEVVQLILSYVSPKTAMAEASIPRKTAHEESVEAILKRFGNDISLYRKLLDNYRSDLRQLTDKLQQQLDAGDISAIGQTLHTLKGTSATIGVSAVRDKAANLEIALRTAKDPEALTLKFARELVPALNELAAKNLDLIHGALPELVRQQAPDEVSISNEELMKMADELAAHLHTGNLKALDLVGELHQALMGLSSLNSDSHRLVKLTESLKFKDALNLLSKLREQL